MIIDKDVSYEIIINKSKFITYLYKVKTKDEITSYLNFLKKEYKDATHICYAYILLNECKYFDDSEPVGTAGIPILEVLKKNQLNYIVCFVIRYYGGIKLGSGGLIRAYSNSCSLALKETTISKFEKHYKILLTITYEMNKTLEKILNDKNILEKDFQEKITYILSVNEKEKEILDSYHLDYSIIDDNYF